MALGIPRAADSACTSHPPSKASVTHGTLVLPELGQCSKAGEPRETHSAGRQECLATGAVEDAAFLPDTLAAVRAGSANSVSA